MIKRNNAEIYAITEYLYKEGNFKQSSNYDYLGDATNGEILIK